MSEEEKSKREERREKERERNTELSGSHVSLGPINRSVLTAIKSSHLVVQNGFRCVNEMGLSQERMEKVRKMLPVSLNISLNLSLFLSPPPLSLNSLVP